LGGTQRVKVGRFIGGIIVLFIDLFYYTSKNFIEIDFVQMMNTYYGTIFGSTFLPVLLLLIAIILMMMSIERKGPKKDYSQEMGKQCPACGQIISKLATKCPYCGKIQH
jgi:uncharacterized membrane protein